MSRRQWEYMEVSIGETGNLAYLDTLGREGWEAYAANLERWEVNGYKHGLTIFYLKRPLEQGQEQEQQSER